MSTPKKAPNGKIDSKRLMEQINTLESRENEIKHKKNELIDLLRGAASPVQPLQMGLEPGEQLPRPRRIFSPKEEDSFQNTIPKEFESILNEHEQDIVEQTEGIFRAAPAFGITEEQILKDTFGVAVSTPIAGNPLPEEPVHEIDLLDVIEEFKLDFLLGSTVLAVFATSGAKTDDNYLSFLLDAKVYLDRKISQLQAK